MASTKSIKPTKPTPNLSTEFNNPTLEAAEAIEDGLTQGPTMATTETMETLITTMATATQTTQTATTITPTATATNETTTRKTTLKITEALSKTMQTETRESHVSTAKSRDIIKTTASKGLKTTNPASPLLENHTGRNRR